MDAEERGREDGQRRADGQEPCPQCGRPRAGGAPCECGADAEEFSPLRVRPYVTVGEEEADGAEPEPTTYGAALPEATTPLPPVPGPGVPGAAEPEAEARDGARRKGVYVASGAAVVAVGAVAALFAGGAFSSDPGTAGPPPSVAAAEGGPSTVRTGGTQAPPSASASLSPTAGTSPSASASASPSVSASGTTPSPHDSAPGSPSASASEAASPLPTRDDVPEPPTAGPSEQRPPKGITAVVLRRGDSGPEVTELEARLRAVGIYPGRDDGHFDRALAYALTTYQVTRGATDEHGVYGADTRTKLEGETPQLG
ncbi:peptidoglycan-binding protein [Streptomyces sp. CH6]|uniref:peptidoglycan-binding protein n=1 Tax=Streptomyces sp. CH6 TaxID=3420320 RepID=UPI0004CB8529